MAKGRRPASCVSCPASGRQVGTVRKGLDKKTWSARFQFGRSGERIALDGPARASRVAAETDRQHIAGAMSLSCGSSRMDAASAAIECLSGGEVPTLQDGPGSASSGADEVKNLGQAQLREVANQTPGILLNKKNEKGKWVHKTSKELKEELLAHQKAASARSAACAPVSDSTKVALGTPVRHEAMLALKTNRVNSASGSQDDAEYATPLKSRRVATRAACAPVSDITQAALGTPVRHEAMLALKTNRVNSASGSQDDAEYATPLKSRRVATPLGGSER
jgi:hypothetical protein